MLVWTLLNVVCRIRRVAPLSGRAGDPTFSLRCLLLLTAMLNAVGVQSKGPTDKYATEAMTPVIQDLGHAPRSLCDLTVNLRLWQCCKLCVTELVDANPLAGSWYRASS